MDIVLQWTISLILGIVGSIAAAIILRERDKRVEARKLERAEELKKTEELADNVKAANKILDVITTYNSEIAIHKLNAMLSLIRGGVGFGIIYIAATRLEAANQIPFATLLLYAALAIVAYNFRVYMKETRVADGMDADLMVITRRSISKSPSPHSE